MRCPVIFALVIAALSPIGKTASAGVIHDAGKKTVTISTADQSLVLRLNYDGKCLLDQVRVRGRDVTPSATGVCSGIQVAGRWYTTRSIAQPKVIIADETVVVSDIRLKGGGVELSETWTFTVRPEQISWWITRKHLSGGTLDDTYFPGWDFTDQSWAGALLGTGGVAWFKLFDTPLATYGVHTGDVVLWNTKENATLRIRPSTEGEKNLAVRFSRHPHGVISLNYSVTDEELAPKHGQHRFLRDRQDVWTPFQVKPGEVTVGCVLSAPEYSQTYDRGTLQGIDGAAVREICNTIARLGAIDAKIHGSNGWYSGFAVLQEQWIAQLGLAIDDPYYFISYSDTLDYQRDHAVGPDGRVKPRWHYTPGDAMPGTYDANGFYECQWGWMLDSQPCYVTNVAEQFDFNGDLFWVYGHKAACEKALDYLLRRDSNGNGLVEMMTDSHTEKKGSDWLDIVWASFENALVNAQMYNALTLWADVEEELGDPAAVSKYRQAAKKLKDSYNRSTAKGGFWDPERRCYVHWRDKDGSIHGTNLVTPVNFLAIACGICDDAGRRKAILDQIESQMQNEKLFFWPACMRGYQPDEGGGGPFPTYENGDIFLAWGELGIRAYAPTHPEVAVRIVKNVLAKYNQDGLAFQRYLRKTQTGAGEDILSNMASPVVGLYRNIYGVRPKWNRLCLEPHLTPELAGTHLKYWLRGKIYGIDLEPGDYAVTVDRYTVRDRKPFAVNVEGNTLLYYSGARKTPSLTVGRAGGPLMLRIETWPAEGDGPRKWTETCRRKDLAVRHVVHGLTPNRRWKLSRGGGPAESVRTDAAGNLAFTQNGGYSQAIAFELQSAD